MNDQEPIEVFPTVGATRVNVDADSVYIGQDDYTGNGERLEVDIPRPMLLLVMRAIFSRLSSSELSQIGLIASSMAQKASSRE